ncbi:10149_t:CDS:2, partial [Funneliformis geosporum]
MSGITKIDSEKRGFAHTTLEDSLRLKIKECNFLTTYEEGCGTNIDQANIEVKKISAY